jgi:hypothetical protein
MKLVFKGRWIEAEMAWNGVGRSRDPVDAYIGSAYWEDTGADLTDAELDELQIEADAEIYEAAHLSLCEGE